MTCHGGRAVGGLIGLAWRHWLAQLPCHAWQASGLQKADDNGQNPGLEKISAGIPRIRHTYKNSSDRDNLEQNGGEKKGLKATEGNDPGVFRTLGISAAEASYISTAQGLCPDKLFWALCTPLFAA